MTVDEFNDWFDSHGACFTGLAGWLDKVTSGANAPTRTAILRQWYGVLADVDLAAAKSASQAMHRGDVPEPVGYDRHPGAIRRACGLSRKASDLPPWERERFDATGERTYACPLCLDFGMVVCWHPVSMKAAVDGTLGQPFTVYTVAVCCSCEAGRGRDKKNELPHFDPKNWLPVERSYDETERYRLTEWMASRRVNGRGDFEEFQ